MKFTEIKAAIVRLEATEQRRLILEILPEIWSNLVRDEACLELLRKLVDAESVRKYQEEHMDHI